MTHDLGGISPELTYVGLLFGLFVVPKVLERYRVPSAITGLFLFAGMEVDVAELRTAARVLVEHLGVRVAVPHAPRSEFAFLIIIATVCAMVTRRLGIYYLVGAFVVGIVARGFRTRLPALSSEKMLHAVEAFASVFVPFYFFHAGLEIRREDLGVEALQWTLGFVAVVIPFRLVLVSIHRRWRLGETWRQGLKVSVSMLPTLVFTLVIAQIMRERFGVQGPLFSGLLGYALVNTLIPSVTMRLPRPEFESPQLPRLEEEA